MPGGPVKPSWTETTLEQPGSSIVTPYIASAVSIGPLVVGDRDELGLFGHLAEQWGEAVDVGLVERGVDLVEDAEGRT